MKSKQQPFADEIGCPEHFEACLSLMLYLFRKGMWKPEFDDDWDHLVQWGWVLGVALPARPEEY